MLRKEKDNILIIQKALMAEIGRLNDDDHMEANSQAEVHRAGAISKTSTTFLKSVSTRLAIKSLANGNEKQEKELARYVGIIEDED